MKMNNKSDGEGDKKRDVELWLIMSEWVREIRSNLTQINSHSLIFNIKNYFLCYFKLRLCSFELFEGISFFFFKQEKFFLFFFINLQSFKFSVYINCCRYILHSWVYFHDEFTKFFRCLFYYLEGNGV